MKAYGVQGIPTLVLLDGETGKLITVDGRSAIISDPEGKRAPFPAAGSRPSDVAKEESKAPAPVAVGVPVAVGASAGDSVEERAKKAAGTAPSRLGGLLGGRFGGRFNAIGG